MQAIVDVSSTSEALRAVAGRGFVLASAGLLLFIGASLVVDPVGFQASAGIWMPSDPALASDLRGSGGVLLSTGLWMLAGMMRRSLTVVALAAGSTLYLSYGLARVVGMALDGVAPEISVIYATLELVVGGVLAGMAWRR